MHKLEKNIQRTVASKVLKSIYKIVDADLKKQKEERLGALLVLTLVAAVVALVLLLNYILLN